MRDDTLDKLKNLLLTARVRHEPGDQTLLIDLHVLPHAGEEKHRAAEKKAEALASILRAISTIALQECKDEKPLPPQKPHKKRYYDRSITVYVSDYAFSWLQKKAYKEFRYPGEIGGRIVEQFSQGMYAKTCSEGKPPWWGKRRNCISITPSDKLLRWLNRVSEEDSRPRSVVASIIIEQVVRGFYVPVVERGIKK